MLKNILKLEGAQKLTKNEQKSIKGGQAPADWECGTFKIVNLSQGLCLAYDYDYRPVYLGNNRCSLLSAPC